MTDPRLTDCPHRHSVPQTAYGLIRCLDCGIVAGPRWFPPDEGPISGPCDDAHQHVWKQMRDFEECKHCGATRDYGEGL